MNKYFKLLQKGSGGNNTYDENTGIIIENLLKNIYIDSEFNEIINQNLLKILNYENHDLKKLKSSLVWGALNRSSDSAVLKNSISEYKILQYITDNVIMKNQNKYKVCDFIQLYYSLSEHKDWVNLALKTLNLKTDVKSIVKSNIIKNIVPIKLNPKMQLGDNGVNHCWLNSALYVVVAYWNFFKQFHDDNFLRNEPINCELKNDNYYNDIYKYLDELNKTNIWSQNEYINMYNILSRIEGIDLPNYRNFGNAQEFIQVFISAIFKQCPMHKIIQLLNMGISKPLEEKDLITYNYPSTDKQYELIGILKPTKTINSGINMNVTRNVSHWVAYVRNKNNKFYLFDMLRRGTQDREIDFKNIFTEKFNNNQIYQCSFLYVNKDFIDIEQRFFNYDN